MLTVKPSRATIAAQGSVISGPDPAFVSPTRSPILGEPPLYNLKRAETRVDPIVIVLTAVGLAMDSFAVSICSGISMRPVRALYALRSSLFFGVFLPGVDACDRLVGRASFSRAHCWL